MQRFKTLAVHAGQAPDPAFGAVMTPIYQTSTFAFQGVNRAGPYDCSRRGNPTRKALESCLAALENGLAGFVFATGAPAAVQQRALELLRVSIKLPNVQSVNAGCISTHFPEIRILTFKTSWNFG
jgi:cystathionine beta-lyase/cystathionine gamma-synthase